MLESDEPLDKAQRNEHFEVEEAYQCTELEGQAV